LTSNNKTPVIVALVANLVVAITKLIVAYFSRSTSVLAEAVHSLSDTVNQILLLTGINLSARPPSAKHPFGRGKEQFFWSFLVSLVVFWVSATFSITQGLSKIGRPPEITHLELTVLSLFFIALVEGTALYITRRNISRRVTTLNLEGIRHFFRESKDPVILAAFLEDAVALFGVLVALGGVSLTYVTGKEFFDAIAAIVIGLALAAYGLILAFESKDLLIGEGISKKEVRQIEDMIRAMPEVVSVVDVRGIYFGPEKIVLGLEVEFKDGLKTEELESVIDRIERKMKAMSPKYEHIYVEAEKPEGLRKPSS
jgi:cation diffusion facilitator family transporter